MRGLFRNWPLNWNCFDGNWAGLHQRWPIVSMQLPTLSPRISVIWTTAVVERSSASNTSEFVILEL
jgi:hypothetical protein